MIYNLTKTISLVTILEVYNDLLGKGVEMKERLKKIWHFAWGILLVLLILGSIGGMIFLRIKYHD